MEKSLATAASGGSIQIPVGGQARQHVSARSMSLRSLLRRIVTVASAAVLVLWALAALAVVAFSMAPRVTGHQVLIVRSGSMEPALMTGAVVVVRPVPPETLRAGDVITYERTEGVAIIVTHRIVEVQEGGPVPSFVTKGDANTAPDSYTVTYRDIGWIVVGSVPILGYFYNVLAHPIARGLLVGIPALFLTLSFLRDIWRKPR